MCAMRDGHDAFPILFFAWAVKCSKWDPFIMAAGCAKFGS